MELIREGEAVLEAGRRMDPRASRPRCDELAAYRQTELEAVSILLERIFHLHWDLLPWLIVRVSAGGLAESVVRRVEVHLSTPLQETKLPLLLLLLLL